MDDTLTEQQRMDLIDHFLINKEKLNNMLGDNGFVDFSLRTLMNDECQICKRSKIQDKTCYGIVGSIPCLLFKE